MHSGSVGTAALRAPSGSLLQRPDQTATQALAETQPSDEGDRDDDWWYSLSLHHKVAAAEPQRAGWRLRVRHLLHDQPLSHRFRDHLEALHRWRLLCPDCI